MILESRFNWPIQSNQIHVNRPGTPRGNQKHWKEKFYPAAFTKSTIIIDCIVSDKATTSNQFNSLIKAELFDSFRGETFCNLGLSYHLRSVNGFWCFCGAISLWSLQMKFFRQKSSSVIQAHFPCERQRGCVWHLKVSCLLIFLSFQLNRIIR